MFRQHAWEAGSSWAGEGALRFLLSSDPVAAEMRRTAIFKIFPLCDPDGVARVGVRFNANGFDFNRNWGAVNETKMPEIAAQRKAILDWVDAGRRVDLFLTLHNTETSEYLEGPPDAEGRYHLLMERLFKLLSESKTFAPGRPPRFADASTSIDKPGRMTVIQVCVSIIKLTGCPTLIWPVRATVP
jgi:Zinc carboxypeptidase